MLAFANEEAVRLSLETGDAWFWSRSRRELWHKGASSGNYLRMQRVRRNCEDNSLLYEVIPSGPACHTGRPGCFYRDLDGTELAPPSVMQEGVGILDNIFERIQNRQKTMPKGSYVAELIGQGIDRISKKVGEEAAEVIIAAKNGNADEVTHEVADLWFHTLVLLAEQGVSPGEVEAVLAARLGLEK